jgi:hypothetical protein
VFIDARTHAAPSPMLWRVHHGALADRQNIFVEKSSPTDKKNSDSFQNTLLRVMSTECAFFSTFRALLSHQLKPCPPHGTTVGTGLCCGYVMPGNPGMH